MKKVSKRFLALFLTLAMVVAMVPAIFAETKNGLSVEIITDKEAYEVGDEIKVTVKVENKSTTAIENVKVDVALPDGIVLAEGSTKTVTFDSLDAGATDTKEVDAVVKEIAVPGTGDYSKALPFVVLAILACAVLVFAKVKKVKGVGNVAAVILVVSVCGLASPIVADAASGKFEASKTVKVGGNDVVITAEVTYDYVLTEVKHVTVHDPSIVKDPETGMYYVFGSHRAWAKSDDLINWTTFTNNINSDYKTLFADAAKWSALGGNQGNASGYDVSGNCWAPDVIYNEEMGKWCMYMSINGDYWYTSTVLLTADDIEGDWTVVGPVVYSGFKNAEEAAKTDFYDVYEGTDFPSRYTQNRNGNRTYGMNAIDPCVFYDEDGKLWMVYGSWFGGLYMIELDPATGLRLASHKYETIDNVSDEYQGIKIAGGNNVSGEAPYIEYIDGYYYLYVTLGGLTSNGGYNMRVFRSENVEGPYTDLTGNDARYVNASNNINAGIGVRVMSNYKWDYMDYGYVAQGHNSAFVDEDGKAYVVYHTRFDNQGEGHQVRVHQQFVNEDGWLVTAPFEYTGETLEAVKSEDVVGTYSILEHKLNVDYASKECVQCVSVQLKEDGTITGDKTGTWKFSEAKGAPYVTMTIGGVDYNGVFVKQQMEERTTETMTLTVLGDNEINIWGYSLSGSEEDLAQAAADELTAPIGAMADVTLPTAGLNSTTITWKSSNTAVMSDTGVVTKPAKDTVVTMTATVTYGSTSVTKDFDIKVFADFDSTEDKVIWTYADDDVDLTNALKGTYQYQNPFNVANVAGINVDSGVSIKFHVKATGTSRGWGKNILSFNNGAAGGLFVMDMAYLGYNGGSGYFDANMKNGAYTNAWQNGTNFLGNEADVEIKLLPTGYEYYVNGELVYTNEDVPYTTSTGLADDANDKVPGVTDMKSYTQVLTYLNQTANMLNLGWGSYWDGGFQGTISDIELSVLGTPEIDLKGNLYLEEFVTTTPILTEWSYHSSSADVLSAEYSEDHGYYLKYVAANGKGNRGLHKVFDEEYQLDKNYVLEADIMLNSGSNRDTQFTIFGTDRNNLDNTGNKMLTSGYIFQMTVASGKEDVTVTGSDETFTIPKNTWVHVKFTVDDTGKVLAMIGENRFVVDVNGSGKLGGIYALCARSNGMFAIDNITLNHATEADLAEFNG